MTKPLKFVPQLRARSLGNPKVAAQFTDEEMKAGRSHMLGTIFGTVSELKKKDDKDAATVSHVLIGVFEGRSFDKAPLRSFACTLPMGIQEQIIARVEKAEASGEVVSFAYSISTRRAPTDAGYVYAVEPLIDIIQSDPLANVRELIEKSKKKK